MTSTILLVEDDDILRRLLGRLLRGRGYTVLEAGNGETAESLCREQPVDLVVSDVCMKGKTGPQLGLTLKANDPRLPVLYMSGYPENHPLVGPVGTGDGFLSKPFTPDHFLSRVRDLLAV